MASLKELNLYFNIMNVKLFQQNQKALYQPILLEIVEICANKCAKVPINLEIVAKMA